VCNLLSRLRQASGKYFPFSRHMFSNSKRIKIKIVKDPRSVTDHMTRDRVTCNRILLPDAYQRANHDGSATSFSGSGLQPHFVQYIS
jgi:hypothetical protein